MMGASFRAALAATVVWMFYSVTAKGFMTALWRLRRADTPLGAR